MNRSEANSPMRGTICTQCNSCVNGGCVHYWFKVATAGARLAEYVEQTIVPLLGTWTAGRGLPINEALFPLIKQAKGEK